MLLYVVLSEMNFNNFLESTLHAATTTNNKRYDVQLNQQPSVRPFFYFVRLGNSPETKTLSNKNDESNVVYKIQK